MADLKYTKSEIEKTKFIFYMKEFSRKLRK